MTVVHKLRRACCILCLLCVGVRCHTWTYSRGAIAAGGDIQKGVHSIPDAKAICSQLDKCVGFTYDSTEMNPTTPVPIWFKNKRYTNLDPTWSSYLLDMPPPPPHKPMLVNPCRNKTSAQASHAWCNATLPIADRVEDMITRMSVDEKISSLRDASAPIPSLDLPYYDWWSEATHGVASGYHGAHNTVEEPYQTNFPFPITTAMSFNRTLWHAIGSSIGREARAFMNQGNAFSTFWAPVINLAREPRWGRNIECPGEDPYLSGQYAVAFVKGMQIAPEDPGHLQASACCKHYAANSMEHATEGGQTHTRHNFDANITMQDLVDSYLAPFQACVEDGGVSGLMCSYNAINGKPTCADRWLLQEVARDAWGFDGYITSDCGAENDVLVNHHYTQTGEQAVAAILAAGTDSDCGGFMGRYARSALQKGLIAETDLDQRLRMLFRVRMRLAHFDPQGPLDDIPPSAICSDANKHVARDGVTQSVALLKNNGVLPLKPSLKAAVIGPSAKQPWSITSYYGPSSSCNYSYWTMEDAVSQYARTTVYAAGLDAPLSTNTSGFAAAASAASGQDAVVLVLGTDLTSAHEEMDAVNISVPEAQLQLLDVVAAAASVPVVVVTLTAVPLDLTPILNHPGVGAVLHAGQPSVQTLGIGDILYGARVPAGRLIQTIYPQSYADQVSIFDFNMRPGPSAFPRPDCNVSASQPCPLGTNPGRTYRFYEGEAVVPFGFGLSYTTFNYTFSMSPAKVVDIAAARMLVQQSQSGFIRSLDRLSAGAATSFMVNVTNTGKRDADDVVLGFLTPPGAGQNGMPLKTLFAFERVHVPAGESRVVNLYPSFADFTRVDEQGLRVVADGTYTVSFGVKETQQHGSGYLEHVFQAHAE